MAKVKRSKGLENKEQKEIIIEHGGLGTTIANVIEKTGVKRFVEIFVDGKDCGCDEREKKLNKKFPHRFNARCFTENEYNKWKDFKAERTLEMIFSSTVDSTQINFICELYASVFSRPIWFPCASCSPKPIKEMIDKLDKVFDSYE